MKMAEGNVDRHYQSIRKMAENFEFKPESQINEVTLAKKLGTSRTPVREALNRLVAEGFLTFQSRRGFFCRPLGPSQIQALYEVRVAVECEAVRLAITKSTDEELALTVNKLKDLEPQYSECKDHNTLLELDELFHSEIARLSKNPELEKMLANINGRIRFVRLIDLRNKASMRKPDDSHVTGHKKILTMLAKRDERAASRAMRKHIERRREATTEAVARAFAEIYCGDDI